MLGTKFSIPNEMVDDNIVDACMCVCLSISSRVLHLAHDMLEGHFVEQPR